MKPNFALSRSRSLSDIWQNFIQAELKTGSKLSKILEKSKFGGFEKKTLTLYLEDENLLKAAKGQTEPLKKKLPSSLQPCDRIDFRSGTIPAFASSNPKVAHSSTKFENPLQALNHAEFGVDKNGGELSQPVLEAAVKAEKTCDLVYAKLKARTEVLAGGTDNTLTASFNWRVRVGGIRGFRELLLPVFHPIFGVPYIPASSLKGAARAWARQNGESKSEIGQILGILDSKVAKAAKVEFLDSFPVGRCLSVDVATPQWHWGKGLIAYKPEPHLLLSLEQPSFLIGLRPTHSEKTKYIPIVKEWLNNALKSGIGSRVSSGYGRIVGQAAILPCTQTYDFQLWTQGMYGSQPPAKQNGWQGIPEFRPTAIRGILRYWFRAFALSLYSSTDCKAIEETLFGTLGKQGKLSINVLFNHSQRRDPYRYTGKIYLEATEEKYLTLICKILLLATHLGGTGRGSRRPLHLLNGRMRGCHWELEDTNSPLNYDDEQWKQFFQDLPTAFKAVESQIGSYTSSSGQPGKRQQDALDRNAQVWLLKSPEQLAPDKVTDWQIQGNGGSVLGSAMTLLYGNPKFKGENQQKIGNRNVGGALETPSFVWIKSIFPSNSSPYQVVTIFGIDHVDRLAFAQALKSTGAHLVFGQMPSGKSSPKLTRPGQ